jgi:hypothetical protein
VRRGAGAAAKAADGRVLFVSQAIKQVVKQGLYKLKGSKAHSLTDNLRRRGTNA